MINPTDAKEIALHYLGMANQPLTKSNIIKNITIAKTILEMGYPKESIILAIDINIDKMYSLGFIKCVIEEVHKAIVEQARQDEIKDKLQRIKSEKPIYKEVGADEFGESRNREKINRGKSSTSTNYRELFKK